MKKLLMGLLTVFSLSGCAGIKPANTDLCIVNAPPGDPSFRRRKCYNMAKDYNLDGTLKKGAVPVYRYNKEASDLHKFLVIDSPTGTEDGQAELKAWIQKLRKHYANCKSGD